MQVGAIAYQPFVYNANSVSSASLNKVKGIGDDLLTSKTDFSGATEQPKQNENPLKPGETKNFADIMMSQMQLSRMNADRLFNS